MIAAKNVNPRLHLVSKRHFDPQYASGFEVVNQMLGYAFQKNVECVTR